jgi:hypothetical protein
VYAFVTCVTLRTEPPSAWEILEASMTGRWLEGRDWISCMAEIFSLYPHLKSTSRKHSCVQRTSFLSVKHSKSETNDSSFSDVGLQTLGYVDVLPNSCKHANVSGSSMSELNLCMVIKKTLCTCAIKSSGAQRLFLYPL